MGVGVETCLFDFWRELQGQAQQIRIPKRVDLRGCSKSGVSHAGQTPDRQNWLLGQSVVEREIHLLEEGDNGILVVREPVLLKRKWKYIGVAVSRYVANSCSKGCL